MCAKDNARAVLRLPAKQLLKDETRVRYRDEIDIEILSSMFHGLSVVNGSAV